MLIKLGNCKDLLKDLPDNSVHAVITDSPYELAMMGRSWDNTGIAYDKEMWAECLRVLKPGGHLMSFSHARTYHRIACAIEDSGFYLRDQIMWVYAQGMPKSGGLKPCHEPICVARKPFKGSAANLMRVDGIGSFYIEENRVPVTNPQDLADFENNHRVTERLPLDRKDSSLGLFEGGWKQMVGEAHIPEGRYPGNLVTDGSEVVREVFPDSNGQQGDLAAGSKSRDGFMGDWPANFAHKARIESDKNASRFFTKCEFTDEDYEIQERLLFYKKPTKKEKGEYNTHISVKPVSLMQHLIRLVTPKGGTVLDPFMGSGTTGVAAKKEGMNFIGFEMEQESFDIAIRRIQESQANKP